ncbi:MAG: hypothetical protein ACRC9T_02445 [Vibrionaceae bacterium]
MADPANNSSPTTRRHSVGCVGELSPSSSPEVRRSLSRTDFAVRAAPSEQMLTTSIEPASVVRPQTLPQTALSADATSPIYNLRALFNYSPFSRASSPAERSSSSLSSSPVTGAQETSFRPISPAPSSSSSPSPLHRPLARPYSALLATSEQAQAEMQQSVSPPPLPLSSPPPLENSNEAAGSVEGVFLATYQIVDEEGDEAQARLLSESFVEAKTAPVQRSAFGLQEAHVCQATITLKPVVEQRRKVVPLLLAPSQSGLGEVSESAASRERRASEGVVEEFVWPLPPSPLSEEDLSTHLSIRGEYVVSPYGAPSQGERRVVSLDESSSEGEEASSIFTDWPPFLDGNNSPFSSYSPFSREAQALSSTSSLLPTGQLTLQSRFSSRRASSPDAEVGDLTAATRSYIPPISSSVQSSSATPTLGCYQVHPTMDVGAEWLSSDDEDTENTEHVSIPLSISISAGPALQFRSPTTTEGAPVISRPLPITEVPLLRVPAGIPSSSLTLEFPSTSASQTHGQPSAQEAQVTRDAALALQLYYQELQRMFSQALPRSQQTPEDSDDEGGG